MNHNLKRFLLLILVILVIYGGNYLAFNWYYLPPFYEGYDRNFNAERVRIEQPIIEDYFVPKFKDAKRRQIWLTPDSLKDKKLHRSKNYDTEKGKIVFEADFFVLGKDSIDYIIKRSYYYNDEYLKFELTKELNNEVLSRDEIDSFTYDSLITSWEKNF
ncbi:hypothetical protein [Ekhidna sp.]|uniref:hypothetical protein n=1 Tax=Ekhidna sp. TaxID=2608089 RepID=UPI003B507F42